MTAWVGEHLDDGRRERAERMAGAAWAAVGGSYAGLPPSEPSTPSSPPWLMPSLAPDHGFPRRRLRRPAQPEINSNYYGSRFSLYLAGVFTTAAVVSGVVLYAVFAVAALTPQRDVTLAVRANFELIHTFFLKWSPWW